MSLRFVVLMIFSVTLSSYSQAEELDRRTNQFYLNTCQPIAEGEQDELFEMGYCLGYSMASFYHSWYNGELRKYACLPNNVTVGQAEAIWYKFLRENPSMLHKSTVETYGTALIHAFPCQ